MTTRLVALSIVITAMDASSALAQSIGPRLYAQHCATCHDRSDRTRAPDQEALRQRTPEAILAALPSGVMLVQGQPLSDNERRALAVFLSGRTFGATLSTAASLMPNRCDANPAGNLPPDASWNGWGNGANKGFETLLPYGAAMAKDGTVYAGLQDNGQLKISPGAVSFPARNVRSL